MQGLIVLMESSEDAHDISWKGGRLYFNRFCIDEDAACELLGVYHLKESSSKLARFAKYSDRSEQCQADKIAKGKVYFPDSSYVGYGRITYGLSVFQG